MAAPPEPTPSLSSTMIDDDDRELVALGYVPSFKREFSNLATVCVLEANVLLTMLTHDADQFCVLYHGEWSRQK